MCWLFGRGIGLPDEAFWYEEFLKAAQKAKTYFELKEKAQEKIEQKDDFLFVKSEYKIVKIKLSDIKYIEGLKDYVKIYCTNGPKPILSLLTMKSVEEKLPSERFMRVHRSYVVNLANITTIERGNIVFGDLRITVSEKYKEGFEQCVRDRFLWGPRFARSWLKNFPVVSLSIKTGLGLHQQTI